MVLAACCAAVMSLGFVMPGILPTLLLKSSATCGRIADVIEFRWATIREDGQHSLPHVDELLYLGYDIVRRDGEICGDPRYGSILCSREIRS